MVQITQEVSDTTHSILIIAKKNHPLTPYLTEYAKKHGTRAVAAVTIPPRTDHFQIIIVIDEYALLRKLLNTHPSRSLVFITSHKEFALHAKDHFDARVAYLTSYHLSSNQLEQLIWYIFLGKHSKYLEITAMKNRPSVPLTSRSSQTLHFSFAKFLGGLLLFFGLYIIVMIGLLVFALSNHAAVMTQSSCIIAPPRSCMQAADRASQLSRLFYKPIRPLLFLFSLGLASDSLFVLDSELASLSHTLKDTSEYSGTILQHMLLGDSRTIEELKDFKKQINTLVTSLQTTHAIVPNLMPYANEVKSTIEDANYTALKIKSLAPHLPLLFDADYGLLLINNDYSMPGGGLVTHAGVLEFKQNNIVRLTLEGVNQIASPSATPGGIPAYTEKLPTNEWDPTRLLGSADMGDNYEALQIQLSHYEALSDTQGLVVATHEALKSLIDAAGTISIKPYGPITRENFSVKALIYKDDARFIPTLLDVLMQKAKGSNLQAGEFTTAIVNLFSTKQLALLSQKATLQNVFDELYWSGKVRAPECAVGGSQCIVDYIQIVDTRHTFNTAHPAQLQKSVNHEVQIDKNGHVKAVLHIHFKYPSSTSVSTQWYEQVLLPNLARVDEIKLSGQPISYDEVKSSFVSIGFPLQMDPGARKEVTISYALINNSSSASTSMTYQLLIQKQFGAQDADFSFVISTPPDMRPTQYNFTPVVNLDKIFYNTKLDSDRLILLSFSP